MGAAMKDFDQIEAEMAQAREDSRQAERKAKEDARQKAQSDRMERIEFHLAAIATNIKSIKGAVRFFLILAIVSLCVVVFVEIYNYATAIDTSVAPWNR